MKSQFSRGVLIPLLLSLFLLQPGFSQQDGGDDEKAKAFQGIIEKAKETLHRYRKAIHKSYFNLDGTGPEERMEGDSARPEKESQKPFLVRV